MVPEKDVFMFHHVDAFTGRCIIVCHSTSPDIFKFIENSVESIKESIDNHKVVENNILKSNYWEKKSIEARKYKMLTVAYLSGRKIRKIPERYNEFQKVFEKSVGNAEFTDKIKNITQRAKKVTANKVKIFLDGMEKEKKLEDERE